MRPATHLLLSLVVGPFLVFVGHTRPKAGWAYTVLVLLGVTLGAATALALWRRRGRGANAWLLVHGLLFVPLFVAVGVLRERAQWPLFSMLTAVGLGMVAQDVFLLVVRSTATS